MKIIPNILKYVKIYRFNSIFLKEFIAVLFAVLIPLSCLNLTLFFYMGQTKKMEYTNYNKAVLSKAVNTLDTFVQTVDKISYSIMMDEYVQLFMVYPNERLPNKDTAYRTKNIQSRVNSFVLANDLLDSIYVYSLLNNYIISDNTSNIADDFADNQWFYKYKSMYAPLSWIEVRQKENDGEGKYYLSFFKIIKQYSENEGVLVVNIQIDKFKDMLMNAGAQTPYDYYILDNEDKILYTSDFLLLDKKYDQNMVNNSKNELISIHSDYNDWRYIYTYPKHTESVNNSILIILLSLLLCVVVPVLIAYFISLRILDPLTNILVEVEKIAPSSPMEDVADEFKYISRNLLSTFSSYQNVEKDLDGKLKLLKKSQMVALQSQINPHFLYNTLGIISSYAIR